jgi:hypothetical protein
MLYIYFVLIRYNSGLSDQGEEISASTHAEKENYVVLVRKRTIPTERPPHVGEVSANFSG